MIKSFKHKGLEKFFNKGDTSKLNPEHVEKIGDILFIISDWHKLKGNRKNTYSVAVRANWEITFEFKNGNAYILDYEDYH